MFVALDANNKKVSIENAEFGTQYFCPGCGQHLIIRAKDSVAVKAHFAHKKGADCDDFTHDMSEWHLNWQRMFPVECREVPLENKNEKHRADVLINNTVIEFQHSPIKAEEIARRNKFYLSCGYQMIWIFDADNQIKNERGESLDPSNFREFSLCWKRAKRQFSIPMDHGVNVFIDYKTEIAVKGFEGQQINILLYLKSIHPKDIYPLHTFVGDKYYYIRPENFVKDFVNPQEQNQVVPASTIIRASVEYQKQLAEQNKRVVYYRMPVRRKFRF